MKKILSIALTIMTMFSICVPSFAADLAPNKSRGGTAIAEHSVESEYIITIPAYIQVTEDPNVEVLQSKTLSTEERIAMAEDFLNRDAGTGDGGTFADLIFTMSETYSISYFASLCAVIVDSVHSLTEKDLAMAQKGDDEALEQYVNENYMSMIGKDLEGNLYTVNSYYEENVGVTAYQIAYYLENGFWKIPNITHNEINVEHKDPVYYDVTAKEVVIENNTRLNIKLTYDGILANDKGLKVSYDIYKNKNIINSDETVLSVAAGNPEGVYSTQLNAFTQPVYYAGVFTDTVVFNASVDYVGHIYEMGETQSDYVIAEFNENHTKAYVYANGEESDGKMKPWDDAGNSPFKIYQGQPFELVIEEGITSIGGWVFSWCCTLESIRIPDSVTSIGEGAFFNCKNVTEVYIPDSVTSIEKTAFVYLKEGSVIYCESQEVADLLVSGLHYNYEGSPTATTVVVDASKF